MSERMEVLFRGASELGVELTPDQLHKFEVFYKELENWNRRVNLTAITGYHEVQVKHFLDSLSVFQAIPTHFAAAARIIDVGTGAGFPGVPLRIAFPNIQLALVESVGKKARFLEHLQQLLGLTGVQVYLGRAEQIGHQAEVREGFDLAVTRGVAELSVLAEYTLPLCCLGGKAVAWKHGGIQAEIGRAASSLKILGGQIERIHQVELPRLMDDRVLVLVDKIHPTPDQYPRRPGIPAKRPL